MGWVETAVDSMLLADEQRRSTRIPLVLSKAYAVVAKL